MSNPLRQPRTTLFVSSPVTVSNRCIQNSCTSAASLAYIYTCKASTSFYDMTRVGGLASNDRNFLLWTGSLTCWLLGTMIVRHKYYEWKELSYEVGVRCYQKIM
jgi:hypothetical protein